MFGSYPLSNENQHLLNLYVLDQATVSRIKDCKKHRFPICLEQSLSRIFRESAGEMLVERIVKRLDLTGQNITSAEQIWKMYDEILLELAKDLGTDVSEVIAFQCLKEMESMGCTLCPLYQREVMKRQER